MNKIVRYQLMVFVASLLLTNLTNAQNGNIYLFIDSTTIIGNISDNKVYVSETEIAYTIQGNIIYARDTNSRQNMLFTVNAKDILSKKVGLIYQNDAKTIQYITQNSEFFLGDHPIDKENEKLCTFEKINDSVLNVYEGITNTYIGVAQGKFTSQVQLVMAAHLYIKHFSLDEKVRAKMQSLEPEVGMPVQSYIRPYLDHGPYYEWVWDGKILKPAWGYRSEDEWSFDGKYLKPVWSADPQSEWIWDGNMLKPFWDSGVQNQWSWTDNVLKPFWDSNPDLMWTIEGDIVRPMWKFDQELQWQVEGDVPLAIITLIILGKADR